MSATLNTPLDQGKAFALDRFFRHFHAGHFQPPETNLGEGLKSLNIPSEGGISLQINRETTFNPFDSLPEFQQCPLRQEAGKLKAQDFLKLRWR